MGFHAILVILRVLETSHEFACSRITEEQIPITIAGIGYLQTHLDSKLRDIESLISPETGSAVEFSDIIYDFRRNHIYKRTGTAGNISIAGNFFHTERQCKRCSYQICRKRINRNNERVLRILSCRNLYSRLQMYKFLRKSIITGTFRRIELCKHILVDNKTILNINIILIRQRRRKSEVGN